MNVEAPSLHFLCVFFFFRKVGPPPPPPKKIPGYAPVPGIHAMDN